MALIESGSKKFSTNKKDWVFLLKLAGLAIAAALVTLGVEQFDIIKSLVPDRFAPLLTGLLLPVLGWVIQWVSDAKKKLENEAEEDDSTPLPPMTSIFLALCLFIPGEAWGQVVAYQGDTYESTAAFKPYTLIRMECESEGKSYVWILRRLPDGFRPDSIRVNSGKELVWTGPPGSYDVDTIYTDKDGVLQQLFSRVVIEGTDNTPTPVDPVDPSKPDPKPNPDGIKPLPKPDAARFGFAPVSYDQALLISTKDRTLAEKIAENYGSVSAAIFAGGIVDVNKAFEELRNRNKELANDPRMPAWNTWFEKLGFKVNDDWGNKKFTTRSDIAEVFREIQVGLLASIGKKPE